MQPLKSILVAATLVLGFASAAAAHDHIKVSKAWIRETGGRMASTAAYLTISNNGADDITLIGASADFAGSTTIHDTVVDADGKAGMRPAGEIVIPAGETLLLAPRGKHIMLTKLSAGLNKGEKRNITLMFKGQDNMVVEAQVMPITGAQWDKAENMAKDKMKMGKDKMKKAAKAMDHGDH